jgi:hypothetical protein
MFAFLSTFSIRAWLRIGAALVLALAIGWVVWQLRAGAAAQAEAERLEAQLELHEAAAAQRARVNAAEAARLAAEEQDRQLFGRLQDEAASDPDAANPALSLRMVQRLNAIR